VGTVWAEMGISEVDAGAAEDAAPDPVRDAAEAD
jgi:hypothetical protein